MPGPIGAIFLRPVVLQRPARYRLAGVTRDAAGAALPNALVRVFETESGLFRADTVSDASGNYSLDVTGDGVDPESGAPLAFTIVAYKAGGPDVAGTTANTLVGTPS